LKNAFNEPKDILSSNKNNTVNNSNGNTTQNNINNGENNNNNNLLKINEAIKSKQLTLVALFADLVIALAISGVAEKILGRKLNAGLLGFSGLLNSIIGIYQTFPK